jgi:hypothetical protein
MASQRNNAKKTRVGRPMRENKRAGLPTGSGKSVASRKEAVPIGMSGGRRTGKVAAKRRAGRARKKKA